MAKQFNVKVSEVVLTGNHRKSLEAVRDHLAYGMDDPETTARDKAVIAKQLQAVLNEIANLPDPSAPDTPLDLIKKGRESE